MSEIIDLWTESHSTYSLFGEWKAQFTSFGEKLKAALFGSDDQKQTQLLSTQKTRRFPPSIFLLMTSIHAGWSPSDQEAEPNQRVERRQWHISPDVGCWFISWLFPQILNFIQMKINDEEPQWKAPAGFDLITTHWMLLRVTAEFTESMKASSVLVWCNYLKLWMSSLWRNQTPLKNAEDADQRGAFQTETHPKSSTCTNTTKLPGWTLLNIFSLV